MNASTHTADPGSAKRKRALLGLTGFFLLIALGYFVYWLFVGRYYASTDDAYVHGNLVAITARVPGTVETIGVDDTDRVRRGQVLIALDPTDARIRLRRQEGALALAIRDACATRARLKALKAEARAARSVYREALGKVRRRAHLMAIHAISAETWQDMRARAQALGARYRAARAQAAAVAAVLGHGPIAQWPAVRIAEARVLAAYTALARCVVRAPVSGYVAKRSVQLGEHIAPGQPLMVIIPLSHLWITANFKEDDLGSLRLGQKARVVTSLYGDAVVYRGRVVGIGAGTGSAFSILPPNNASGNWIRIVQRVPVRISLPARALETHPLRVGLSATATVNIHDTSGRMLAQRPPSRPVYQTPVYGRNIRRGERIVRRILRANGARRTH
ncbi:MAG: HlyD family efflux transporter periplasmic adaptor subunit [Gammaproteobacteria bacterium]|nr:HlyD family efflux transporter periplasmic adaptor subunit [Gammaproteobacteria bacterium]